MLAPPAPAAKRGRRAWAAARGDVVAALPAWGVSRVLVVAAWAVLATVHVHNPAAHQQVHQGLFAWDAGWYRGIARHGYGFSPPGAGAHEALRFFPLLPVVSWLLGGSSVAIVAVVWAAALVLGALVHRLVLIEGKGAHAARLSVWCVLLFPSAFVLVLGYAEALAMALGVGMFIALRRQRWWLAAGLGVLAGLSRPLGVLLAVPAVVEVARAFRLGVRGDARTRAAWGAAVAGPVAGLVAFLTWSWRRYGDFLLPLRVQTKATHRGQVVDPFTALWHEGSGILHGHHIGSALHVPWAVCFIALAVVAFRRFPASYGAYAAAVLVVALTSKNLDSLERYGLGAFPLVLALATLLRTARLERAWLAASSAALEGYAVLALLNKYVP